MNLLQRELSGNVSFCWRLVCFGQLYIIRTLDDNFAPDADPWNSHLGRGEQRAACLAWQLVAQRVELVDASSFPPSHSLDAKGETIFRRRPYYYAFDGFNEERIARGLLANTVPRRLVETRTAVCNPSTRFGKATLSFIEHNYLRVGQIEVRRSLYQSLFAAIFVKSGHEFFHMCNLQVKLVSSEHHLLKLDKERKVAMSLFTFKTQLQSQLEQSAEEAVSRLTIDPACELALRALVTAGVERMETEGHLGVKDIAMARSNLKRFIDEMKVEAVFLGHVDQLDYVSFQAADRTIERRRHANPTTAALWPFWPNECVRPRT